MDVILNIMTDEQLLKKINQIVGSQLEPVKTTLQEHSVILQEHSVILQEHSVILQEHSTLLQEHSKSLKTLKNQMKKTNKTLDIVIRNFDGRIVENSRETERIKGHLSLSSKH